MKKVLFIMMIAVLLVAFAAPVFADKDGVANESADFGKLHKNADSNSEMIGWWKGHAEAAVQNLGQYIKTDVK